MDEQQYAEPTEEQQEEILDEFEQGQDISDAQLESYNAGLSPQNKDTGLYNWFWKVVRLDKPFRLAKVGNLNNQEIGEHGVTMRDAMNLAHLGQTFHHSKFGNYWAIRSKIVAATSMSRKGWFMDLSISQKKVRERAKQSASSEQKQKWRLFNRKKEPTQQ